MDFHEEAVYAGSCRCPGQVGNEFPLSAGGASHATGELYAVGGIKNNGVAELTHNGERAHIHHQVMVAEGCPPFCHCQIRIMGFFHFFNHIFHVFRCHELALFHIHRFACHGSAVNQVCLAAEEGGNLQHIQHFGCRSQLGHIMDVGQYRHLQLLLDIRQDFQALFQSRSAERMEGRTVGFIVGCFEYILYPQPFTDFLDFPADHERAVITFNNAGAGDEEELFPIQCQISYMDCFHK